MDQNDSWFRDTGPAVGAPSARVHHQPAYRVTRLILCIGSCCSEHASAGMAHNAQHSWSAGRILTACNTAVCHHVLHTTASLW